MVGVAAFRRAGTAQIVFDAANPLDLGPLKDDPVFGGVTERVLPDGMNLRMKLSPDLQIRVLRRPGGWALAVVHQQPMLKAITAHAEKGVLAIGADSPGHVVVLGDESTGGKLLVGTQKSEGQANPGTHRDAEFIMPPTWQGVVVEPLSGSLVVAAGARRFRVAGFRRAEAGIAMAGRCRRYGGVRPYHDAAFRSAEPAGV